MSELDPPNVSQDDPTSAKADVSATAPAPRDITPPPSTELVDDDMSGASILPDVMMDDSAPPATCLQTIVDHTVGETIVDGDQTTAPTSAPAASSSRSFTAIQVATTPHPTPTSLAEIPPTLLSEDEDVRPQWLVIAIRDFLQYVPYLGNLGKVVDLFLAQEARLGYPQLVGICPRSIIICPNLFCPSHVDSHSHLQTGRLRLPPL